MGEATRMGVGEEHALGPDRTVLPGEAAEETPGPLPPGRRLAAAAADALVVLFGPAFLWLATGFLFAAVAPPLVDTTQTPGNYIDRLLAYLLYSFAWVVFGSDRSVLATMLVAWGACAVIYLWPYLARRGTRATLGMRYAGLRRTVAKDGVALAPVADDAGFRRPTSQEAGGARNAGFPRRALSRVIDAVIFVGAPPWWLLIPGPLLLIAELFVLVLPVVFVGLLPWSLAKGATRSHGVRVVSVGQMLTGLRRVDGDGRHRLVLARDLAPAFRVPRPRLAAAALALALALPVAAIALSGTAYIAANILFGEQIQAAMQERWEADIPEARDTANAFLREVRSGRPRAGESFVTGQAAEDLPRYRDHVRQAKVSGYDHTGWGGGWGIWDAEWELMILEKVPVSGEERFADLSIVMKRRGSGFAITQLSWSEPPEPSPASESTGRPEP